MAIFSTPGTNRTEGWSILFSVNASGLGFEQFYAAHASRMVKIAHSIVRDQHAAEDVVQTAFAKAFASWWRVGRADDPVAYVRRTVVNASLAHLRKPARRHEHPLANVPERTDRNVEHRESSSADPNDLWALLGKLPPRRRAVLVLRYYEDLSEREIADVLKCRPGTVKSQAAAGLRTLRAQLTESSEVTRGLL